MIIKKYLALLFFINFVLIENNAQNNTQLKIKDNINNLTFQLMSKLSKQNNESNFVYSSFSLVFSLSMVYMGTEGETKSEFDTLFNNNLNSEEYAQGFHDFLLQLNDTIGRKSIKTSNSLWIEEKYKVLPKFENDLKQIFNSSTHNFKCATENEANISRQQINKYIESVSDGQLQNVLPDKVLNPLTRLLLINIVAFDAKWEHKFEVTNTKEDNFNLYNGTTVKTSFMNQTFTVGYYQDPIVQAVSIPYENRRFSLLILLPANENVMRKFKNSLNEENFKVLLNALHNRPVDLSLPKFKTESGFELKDALKSLGMTKLFNDSADFSGITGNRDVFINNILQKTIIEVNENETKAASSTIVVMQLKSAYLPIDPIIFNANKPFMYFIIDNSTQVILFSGVLMNPIL